MNREFTEAEKRVTLWGVGMAFLLSALDQTIIATAMPRIIGDLNGLALYSWVMTAYLLSSTVMVPIWGKLGDLYGRKPILLIGIGIFLAGSCLCGLAGEFGDLPLIGGGMVQLIVSRAIQGIGGGALFTTALAIIADLYPPRERGKISGVFGAAFALSSAVGPLIGGYFADFGTVMLAGHAIAGWRWVFYLNLPLNLLSMLMILVKMPRTPHRPKGKIDFVGAALIIAAVVPLLLALTFGGRQYAWTSPTEIGLFVGSGAGLVLYLFAERFAADPILPLALFKNRVFTTANLAGFLVSMSFMSTVSFLPLFQQLGQGVAATTSGLSTLPLMIGLLVSSIGSGRLVSKTGKYKPPMIAGLVTTALGIWLLSRMTAETSRVDLIWRMLVLGIGLGPSQSLFVVAIQNAMPMTELGVATSSSQFFRQIGASMGVAIFGTFLTAKLDSGLGTAMPGMDLGSLRAMGATAASGAGATVPALVRVIISDAITQVFFLGVYVLAVAFVVALMIPEVPLRDNRRMGAKAPKTEGETVRPAEVNP